MITPEKIEAWIKEVSERPSSAPLLIEYLTSRLRELTSRNEELRAENIALINGKRVEEYEKRIQHLEYQLDLLKRQSGGELPASPAAKASAVQTPMNILVYNSAGQLIRLAFDANPAAATALQFRLQGDGRRQGETPRLLVLPESEEILFVFSSGRVATQAVRSLPSGQTDWAGSPIPLAPRAGETLACLVPLSRFSLADAFIQISRRGFVKKIRSAMAQSILANHYIGSGVTLPADRTMEIVLTPKEERIILVSSEGYLLCLDIKNISASVEEAIRLSPTDHLITACTLGGRENLMAVTQTGKVIHWTLDRLETAASLKTRGQALYSSQRREQGARVVGASTVHLTDWSAALHEDGLIGLAPVQELLAAGALPTASTLLALTTFHLPQPGPA